MSESGKTPAELERENRDLRARLELLEDALENMGHGLCMFDAQGNVAVCNQQYAEVVQLPPGSVRPGMTSLEFARTGVDAGYHPGKTVQEVHDAMWANLTCAEEERVPLRRGNRVLACRPQRTANGNLVATFEDVTKRTEAEEALRTSEARLSAILNAMPDCVKIFADDGTLTYINPHGLELLQAENFEELLAWDEPVIAQEYIGACMDVHQRVIDGETIRWNYEIVGLKGRRLHVEATAVPFRLPDGSINHLCISRDISSRKEADDALRRSEERLRLVQDVTGLADFEAGPDGVAHCSRRLIEQVGLPAETATLTFEDWMKVIHSDDRDRWFAGIVDALDRDDAYSSEFRIVRPDNGEVRWILSHTKVERDMNGNATRTVGAQLDITGRKRAEEALRESEERFRLAAEATGLGVWDYDPVTGKRDWSDRLCEIFGFDPAQDPSLHLASERVHPDDRPRFVEILNDMRDEPESVRIAYTFRISRASDGAERWLTMNGWKGARTESESRVILTVRDVTEERTAEERIRWNASHDGLTQLANRVSFQEQLDLAVRKAKKTGQSFGLLMIDLDHFKQINDALGHQAGDRLLQNFADRLRATVRAGDTVARLGGDEFAVLVGHLDSAQRLAELSRSIHERLREPFIQQGRVLDCRVSIGAAVYPDHGKTPKDLMVSADMALYAAKAEGRSKTIEYRPHLRDEVQRFAAMVGTAREAIQDDRIAPYYQPKLNLNDGSIVGFEALLRWRDKSDGVHLPAGIAAAFEEHEVAAEISERIIGQSISDMRRWLEQGVPFGHVAVNASAAEFRRDDFAERVLESLHKADIPPSCFQLEVTETVFLGRGSEFVQRALSVLHQTGVRIALDDFGTGYASLRHLKEFPVDTVKIDCSFVRDMEEDPNDEAIIKAVINLGKNLGIKVVAEGIERMSQAQRLIELGCDYGQGFLFSEAIPAERIPALVSSFGTKNAETELKLASAGG